MPNIRDVARACGVAPITVSAVLNNRSDKVSAETRERILLTMREMGYRPGPAVRTQAATRRDILGIVSWAEDLWGDSYHSRILDVVGRVAQAHHQHLLLFARYLWFQETQRSIRTYGDGHCDGMILFPYRHDEPLKAALAERGIPFVMVGDTCEEGNYASVDVDNKAGARIAMEHLLTLGHQQIAFLGGRPTMRFSVLRSEGYEAALGQQRISVNPALLSEGEPNADEGYTRTQELLKLPLTDRPTALFCATDNLAFGAIRALTEQGIRIPEDMSVIGFDDHTDALSHIPPLTTLRQPYQEIGTQTIELLLKLIAGSTPEQIVLPGELIVRASTGPPSF